MNNCPLFVSEDGFWPRQQEIRKKIREFTKKPGFPHKVHLQEVSCVQGKVEVRDFIDKLKDVIDRLAARRTAWLLLCSQYNNLCYVHYNVHTVHAVHAVHTVHTVHTVHAVHTVHTRYIAYNKKDCVLL